MSISGTHSCGRRFTSAGRLTNYEMEGLRADPPPRRCRYLYMWESVNYPNHPTNKEQWREFMNKHWGTNDDKGGAHEEV